MSPNVLEFRFDDDERISSHVASGIADEPAFT